MKAFKGNKGSTLICFLLITFIVMANVSRMSVSTTNDMLTEAQKAKVRAHEMRLEEDVLLRVRDSRDKNGNINTNTLIKELREIGTVEGNKLPLKVTVEDIEFEVMQDGKVEKVEEDKNK